MTEVVLGFARTLGQTTYDEIEELGLASHEAGGIAALTQLPIW
jgi:hypothetical protein